MGIMYAGSQPEKTELKLPTLKKLNNPNERTYFLVDFSKVSNMEEILLLLASIGILISNDNPLYPQLEHLLIKDKPLTESDIKK